LVNATNADLARFRQRGRKLIMKYGSADPLPQPLEGVNYYEPALMDWVEKGNAPDTIRAARVVNNQEVRSRPLCPYPQVARYSGQGSIDAAANFRCTAP
jgi:hypothetical protein